MGMFRDLGVDESVVTVVLGKLAPPPAPAAPVQPAPFKGLSP